MQQWTSDKYLATVSRILLTITHIVHTCTCNIYSIVQPHRVLLPDDGVKWRTVRQSMAFFVHPDNEVMVECIDGSNKYHQSQQGRTLIEDWQLLMQLLQYEATYI